jgi:nitrogen fixation protein NifQ
MEAMATATTTTTTTTIVTVPPPAHIEARRRLRADEVEDVAALLIEHADPRAGSAAERAAVAEAVAVGCLGDDHLWQDLQLASRAALSALMTRWFPALAAKNVHDMKWKRFLYKQLCDRALVQCRAPSCGECSDHARCFGPEDGAAPSKVLMSD